MEPELTPLTDEPTTKKPPVARIIILLIAAFFALVLVFIAFRATSPTSFTPGMTLEVAPGMSVLEISQTAQEQGLVKSPLLLYAVLTYFYDPTSIYAGRYVFTKPTSVFGVAAQLASNTVEEDLTRLTFPEGITIEQMADIIANQLPEFDRDAYVTATSSVEGYLFPETYLIPEAYTATDIVALQKETFDTIVAELPTVASSSPLQDLAEVVILASILEREANDETSMKIVSGILQNRLAIGMALQADATIEYALETPLNELAEGELAENLRELDSPYNSYLYPGLPPTAISNPGRVALEAALEPTPSDYFYYITGTDGEFYYAETLDEHNQNIANYLR